MSSPEYPQPLSRQIAPLESLSLVVSEEAAPFFEKALLEVCATVGFFEADEDQKNWQIEGVRPVGKNEEILQAALMLASLCTGEHPVLERKPVKAEGWLELTSRAFPRQFPGKRFSISGTHLRNCPPPPGRMDIRLDAGVAFGSGEHESTRGCLRALELIAHKKPEKILDMGTGSGILAMGAAKLLHREVLAIDVEPWSVRVTMENAKLNRLHRRIAAFCGNGWHAPQARTKGPYDLVFANILARPLCRMAVSLSRALKPGGTAILAGLLNSQANMVIAAHRRTGLVLERRLREGSWTTLVLSRPNP